MKKQISITKGEYTFTRYEIDDCGNVYDTLTGRIPKKNKNKYGYYYSLYPDQHLHGVNDGIRSVNFNVCNLMAHSFDLPKPEDTNCRAYHINGDLFDDRLDNIEYTPISKIISNNWRRKKEHDNSIN
jgi:hypothetical protein